MREQEEAEETAPPPAPGRRGSVAMAPMLEKGRVSTSGAGNQLAVASTRLAQDAVAKMPRGSKLGVPQGEPKKRQPSLTGQDPRMPSRGQEARRSNVPMKG